MTALKWPVTPRAMDWGVRFLWQRYGLPLYVTENGQSCNDRCFWTAACTMRTASIFCTVTCWHCAQRQRAARMCGVFSLGPHRQFRVERGIPGTVWVGICGLRHGETHPWATARSGMRVLPGATGKICKGAIAQKRRGAAFAALRFAAERAGPRTRARHCFLRWEIV